MKNFMRTLPAWIALMSMSAWCAVEDNSSDVRAEVVERPIDFAFKVTEESKVDMYRVDLRDAAKQITGQRQVVIVTCPIRVSKDGEVQEAINALEDVSKLIKARIEELKNEKKRKNSRKGSSAESFGDSKPVGK